LSFQLITPPLVFEYLKQYHCHTECHFHTLVLPTLGSGACGGVFIFSDGFSLRKNIHQSKPML
jgi:hypothetical protein